MNDDLIRFLVGGDPDDLNLDDVVIHEDQYGLYVELPNEHPIDDEDDDDPARIYVIEHDVTYPLSIQGAERYDLTLTEGIDLARALLALIREREIRAHQRAVRLASQPLPPLTSAERHAATCTRDECLDNPRRAEYQRRLREENERNRPMPRKNDDQSDEERELRESVEESVTRGDIDWNADDDDNNGEES